MYPQACFQFIAIDSIDLADRTYHLSPFEPISPDNALFESIRQFGVLHPPIIKQKYNSFIVAAGRKRIMAAGQVRPGEKIMCLLIPEGAADQYVYHLLVEDTLCGGNLSLAEQARLFADLLASSPVNDVLPLLAKLGHKPQVYMLEGIVSLLSLHPAVLAAVHRGVIQLKAARNIRKLPPEDQEVLVQLITSLNLGGSKQNKLIDYSAELSLRTGEPLRELLQDFSAGHAAGGNENIPQRAAALLLWLHEKCYPRTTEAEDAFRKSVAALRLPDHMHLEHSLSFEEDNVSLSLLFPDMETVQEALPEILKITEKKRAGA
ncbi:MAG: hypothetical protein SCH71_13960 [Desulfobulbaceae bacterium]|nr:hypothetical protein [Desulfobulbaceae bacterium]